MFIRVLLPAPDGPRMAVSSPDLNKPLTLRRMIFVPVNKKKTKHSATLYYIIIIRVLLYKVETYEYHILF